MNTPHDIAQADLHQAVQEEQDEQDKRRTSETNAIHHSRTRQQQQTQQPTAGNKVISDEIFMATDNDRHMPETVNRQFLKMGDDRYHFQKSPDDLAFIDKGNKLETPSSSHMVAETLVRVAERRGWDEIRVTGGETFRREVWYEAARRGMTVRGYTPTGVDKAKLAAWMQEQEKTPEQTDKGNARVRAYLTEPPAKALAQVPELAGAFAVRAAIKEHLASIGLTQQEQATVLHQVDERMQTDLRKGHLPKLHKEEPVQGIAGKVQEYGTARYNFQNNESESFFVRVETNTGQRTLWGKDLERAIRGGNIQKGQNAAFSITATEQVTVNANVLDNNSGAVVGTRPTTATRNTWMATPYETERMRVLERRTQETEQEAER